LSASTASASGSDSSTKAGWRSATEGKRASLGKEKALRWRRRKLVETVERLGRKRKRKYLYIHMYIYVSARRLAGATPQRGRERAWVRRRPCAVEAGNSWRRSSIWAGKK